MNCVACNEPMVVLELHGIELDYCLACRGIWLDSGEIELLMGSATNADRLLADLSEGANRHRGRRKCPICLKRMDVVTIGEGKQVQVDHCRRGHGLWFDRGELESILAIFEGDERGAVREFLKSMFTE